MPDTQAEQDRIEQFRKMVEADPENELGHFSLGKACLEAGHPDDAVKCLRRVIELNEQFSKAYALLASAQQRIGDPGAALATLRTGVGIASARGDMMPLKEMAAMMRELGEEPEVVVSDAGDGPRAGEGEIMCRRCGEAKQPLAARPFKGELGEKVHAGICPDCWNAWIHMGTKVINELRLDFSNPQHAEAYDKHMAEFLNLAD